VAHPKTPMLVKDALTTDDARRLIDAAKADKRNGMRDTAIILFLLDTGCRAAEVVGLKNADILWAQRMAKVYGKGDKERVVFFSAETMRAMKKYAMRDRRAECDRFFQTEEGRSLTPSGLLHVTKRVGQRAQVTNVHPHRFRHTFALTFLRQGGNVLALQRLLGHTTLAMTQRHVAMVSDDLAREHSEHSPVMAMLGRR
jgi:integrase/recombinase XerD